MKKEKSNEILRKREETGDGKKKATDELRHERKRERERECEERRQRKGRTRGRIQMRNRKREREIKRGRMRNREAIRKTWKEEEVRMRVSEGYRRKWD